MKVSLQSIQLKYIKSLLSYRKGTLVKIIICKLRPQIFMILVVAMTIHLIYNMKKQLVKEVNIHHSHIIGDNKCRLFLEIGFLIICYQINLRCVNLKQIYSAQFKIIQNLKINKPMIQKILILNHKRFVQAFKIYKAKEVRLIILRKKKFYLLNRINF